MWKYFSMRTCKRAPADFKTPSWLQQMVILIGVQKGGTKALFSFLLEHPSVASRCNVKVGKTESFYFDNITQYDRIDQAKQQLDYSKYMQLKCPLAVSSLKRNSSQIFLDDTPAYILSSHRIPKLLNCVMPKSKMILILRNPTDRAFSHYNFYNDQNWCTDKTFDEWVDSNLEALKVAGISNAIDPYDELLAWRRYHDNPLIRKSRKCNSFVTRGLYAIQLLHYLTALKVARRPKSDLHIIISEHLKGDTRQAEFDKLTTTLGLPPHSLVGNEVVHATPYKVRMNATTQAKLDAFFQPYNERLYKMMGWDPLWPVRRV
jgi:Sulfotransferase domain